MVARQAIEAEDYLVAAQLLYALAKATEVALALAYDTSKGTLKGTVAHIVNIAWHDALDKVAEQDKTAQSAALDLRLAFTISSALKYSYDEPGVREADARSQAIAKSDTGKAILAGTDPWLRQVLRDKMYFEKWMYPTRDAEQSAKECKQVARDLFGDIADALSSGIPIPAHWGGNTKAARWVVENYGYKLFSW